MARERDIAKERYAVPIVPMAPFVIEEWLDDEIRRKSFLDAAFDDDSDMAAKKEIVRKSREYDDDPVPDSEFFGY